jgi:hypothetical protein
MPEILIFIYRHANGILYHHPSIHFKPEAICSSDGIQSHSLVRSLYISLDAFASNPMMLMLRESIFATAIASYLLFYVIQTRTLRSKQRNRIINRFTAFYQNYDQEQRDIIEELTINLSH